MTGDNKDADRFILHVIHDLRAPLRQSRSRAEMLERALRGGLEDASAAHLGAVLEANRSMDAFLQRLAEYCRAGSGLDQFTKVNAEFLIGNAIQVAGITRIDTPPELITQGELSGVRVPSSVQKVFVELLDNAFKFRSEATPSIEIRLVRTVPELMFHVRDNGIGFEPESAETIFEPLERLHGIGVYAGFGFGLAISRRIIGALNGRLWAESTPGNGSTFSFSIPAD